VIAVVDYGAGNLRSIQRALAHLGEEPVITGDPEQIRDASAIVFPGVGNARAAMDQLHATGIADAIIEATEQGTPLLGICLGMQLLFGAQEEGPTTGLGLLAGDCVRLPADHKVPHMGWNSVRYTDNGPFAGAPDAEVYFVHSYMVRPDDPADVAAMTDYGVAFPSVVAHETIWGTQFHPEKSADAGIALLGRWLALVRETSQP
jgi:imidazole glycerol-phosphate synthase subunit HisH